MASGQEHSSPLCHTGQACNIPYSFMVSMPNRFVKMKTITFQLLIGTLFTFVNTACAYIFGTSRLKHGFTCDLKGMHGSKSMLSQNLLHIIGRQSNNHHLSLLRIHSI